jgi:arginyl-tRNA synthetase
VLSKANFTEPPGFVYDTLKPTELDLILTLNKYPEILLASATEHSPAQLANYIYELAKLYNKFYHEETILKAEDENTKNFRLALSFSIAEVIKKAMKLLGIDVPERM